MVRTLPPGGFYGRTLRKVEVAGLTFSESVYRDASDLFIPLHAHEDAFFHLVIDGACEERWGRTVRTGGPSDFAFHPAGEPHSNHWRSPGGRVFHIDISADRAGAVREFAPVLDRPTEFLGGPALWLVERLYREYQRLDDLSPLAMEGLALEVVAEASRQPGRQDNRPPKWLSRARELLRDRLAESLPLSEIAAAVGVHPVHLARAFRKHFGSSPGEYTRGLRVKAACRRLAASDEPLTDVALAVGFADQSHFTRAFRRATGVTPGEFRRNFSAR